MTSIRKLSQLLTMSDVELAWLAGWLEGEGCFGVVNVHYSRPNANPSPAITGSSTDLDILQYAQSISGVGTIYKEKKKDGRKQAWQWRVRCYNDAIDLMKTLYPWMGVRRQNRIREVFSIVGEGTRGLSSCQ